MYVSVLKIEKPTVRAPCHGFYEHVWKWPTTWTHEVSALNLLSSAFYSATQPIVWLSCFSLHSPTNL